jgi:hypothetical protein
MFNYYFNNCKHQITFFLLIVNLIFIKTIIIIMSFVSFKKKLLTLIYFVLFIKKKN